MRLIGLTCCMGICQPCITVVEVSMVCGGVLLAVFIRQIAIFTCVALLMAAVYAIYKKFIQKDKNSDDDENQEVQQNGQGQASSASASAPTHASSPASGTSSSQTKKASASSPISPPGTTTTTLQNDEENPPPAHHHTVPLVEADVQAYVAYGCLVAAALVADFWGQYLDRCWTFLAAPESDSRQKTSKNETTLKPALPLYPDYVDIITVQTNNADNNNNQ